MSNDPAPRFTRQMSFVEDEAVVAEIKRQAAHRGTSPSAYVREAVRNRFRADDAVIQFPSPPRQGPAAPAAA